MHPFSYLLSLLQVTDARRLGLDLIIVSSLFASFGVTICVQCLSYSLLLFLWEYGTGYSMEKKQIRNSAPYSLIIMFCQWVFQSFPSCQVLEYLQIFLSSFYSIKNSIKKFFHFFFFVTNDLHNFIIGISDVHHMCSKPVFSLIS